VADEQVDVDLSDPGDYYVYINAFGWASSADPYFLEVDLTPIEASNTLPPPATDAPTDPSRDNLETALP
jgi:hypothetical protein